MKRLLVFLLVLLVPAIIIGWFFWRSGMESAPRRNWKDNAIRQIDARLSEADWVQRELASIEGRSSAAHQKVWFSDELILAANGEWMICRNICQKEPGRIPDLFIGRGSDGKWYYSTFHFCIGKDVLHIEPQPKTLADFIHGYWLEPFDGKSDESLKPTWTSGPYGPARP